MSTKHAIAAARFLENKENEAWHDHTLWMVRTKRDKMSHSLPEWERLRELASEICGRIEVSAENLFKLLIEAALHRIAPLNKL